MIDGSRVTITSLLYSDMSNTTQVHQGTYTPQSAEQPIPVAIKCLSFPSKREAFLNGLMQEIAIQLKLDDCPGACKCYGYFSDERKCYIVMELMSKDLDKDIKNRAAAHMQFTQAELLDMLWQVSAALAYAKRKNIAHRDIKPQNIVIDPSGHLKLVDFGSGSIADGKAEKLTGTPLYMSPELRPILELFQRTGEIPPISINSFMSDVYSLGLTFIHAALLRPPTELMYEAGRAQNITALINNVYAIYPCLGTILNSMLVETPEMRVDFDGIIQYLQQCIPEPAILSAQTTLKSTYTLDPSSTVTLTPSPACMNCGRCVSESELIQPRYNPEYQVCASCYIQWYCEGCGLGNEAVVNRGLESQFVVCKVCHYLRVTNALQ